MSVWDSIFVGIFGIAVVFIVLVGLSLLLKLQSALITRFSQKKPSKTIISEAVDVVLVSVQATTDVSLDTLPSIREPIMAPEPAEPPVFAHHSAPAFHARSAALGNEVVTAPVAGTVIEIMTTVGAKVRRGDLLLLLEAMKMENGIAATRDGTVTHILTSCGKAVIAGKPLVVIQ